MTVLRASNAPIGLNEGKPVSTTDGTNPWVRPSDWITFTAPSPTENKIVGTVAIFDTGSNTLAVNMATADASQYTVNWGDGTSSDHNSGTTAEKNISWSSISSATLTSRGYRQAIITITPKNVGATFTTTQISRLPAGVSSNTTLTSPWLDIAISVPTSNRIEFWWTTGASAGNSIPPSMLEQVQIIASNLSNTAYLFRGLRSLQNVVFNTSASVTTTENMFVDSKSLVVAPFFNTASVTNMSAMFSGCTSLKVVPLYNTASVTNMNTMFQGCSALETVPLFNTASVTNMQNMFTSCSALQNVPLFNTASVTNMSSMFLACTTIKTVPLFNTASVTNMQNMFNSCVSLLNVPLFNTAAVTNFGSMFASCQSLQSVPLFNTAAATTVDAMFQGCNSLQSLPLFNTAAVTNLASMLSNCFTLKEIPELNNSSAASTTGGNLGLGASNINNAAASLGRAKIVGNKFSQSFQNCRMAAAQLDEMYTALATLNPAVTNVTSTGTTVTYTIGAANMSPFIVGRTVTITGVDPVAYNLTNVVLQSRDTVNGTFTVNSTATGAYVSGGIATAVSDRTITVTGNPGTATDNPTIATSKGWTVTG